MPVRVRVAEGADGTFRAEGDAPMLGIHGRPLAVSYRRPNLEVSVATGTGLFEGENQSSPDGDLRVVDPGWRIRPGTIAAGRLFAGTSQGSPRGLLEQGEL
jgi:hypothetical protein